MCESVKIQLTCSVLFYYSTVDQIKITLRLKLSIYLAGDLIAFAEKRFNVCFNDNGKKFSET